MAITMRTAAVAALVMAAVICLAQVEATMAEEGPAAAPAPAPSGTDCLTVLASAFDCLDYLETGSNKSTPGKVCCGEVKGLLEQTDGPLCLCELLANPSASGFDVDKKRALKLPTACGIQADPTTLCQVIGVTIPTSGPTPSPSPSPSAVSGAELSPSPAKGVPTSSPSTATVPASPSLSPPQSRASSHRPHSLALFVGFAITFVPSLFSF